MAENEHTPEFFDSYALRKELPKYVGEFVRVSIGRDYKIGTLERMEYGWAYIQVPSSKPDEPTHLCMVKLSRVNSIELWKKR